MKHHPDLTEHFDPDTLESINLQEHTVYALNRRFEIVFLNDGWTHFARRNEGEAVLDQWSIGRNILEAIPEVLKPFYTTLYQKALKGGTINHTYECCSHETFRKYRMLVTSYPDAGVFFVENVPIAEHPLGSDEESDAPPTRSRPASNGHPVLQCAHCRKTKAATADSDWEWIPELIRRPDPKTNFGLCTVCNALYYPKRP